MPLPLPFQVKDIETQSNFDELAQATSKYLVTTDSRAPRCSWGLIKGSDGSKLAGSADYTPTRTAAGSYTITWAHAKVGTAYVIQVTSHCGASGTLVPNYATKTAANFTVSTFVSTTGANADPTDWSFVVLDAQ